ncbi:MAG: bifunctional glutamate N-acetyltransferase/amino-acid acetyltransferase ArgJ [Myxococcales bacterium]|nr:bifunctional glutamate N-acetyltransferase/amino-acid acetyltransferase ArgJ [Myxococcales bacterium]
MIKVPGFRAAGVACGIKDGAHDLALLVSDGPATAAGVFTRSTVVGAPVEWSRRVARRGRARAVVVNSGCSNVAMGERGRRDAKAMAELAAAKLGVKTEEVFVASTGVIGEPLPMANVRRGIGAAAAGLEATGWEEAARAIMTTDTFPKCAWTRLRLGGRNVTVAGIAKGSGMIEPNMGTMLAFLATDAAVSAPILRRVLKRAADASFNRVTVDGEGSTSDTTLLLASGVAGNPLIQNPRSPGLRKFEAAVREVSRSLARDLARDGEGATKLITIRVSGARSSAEAERAARRIANSMLVKTAIFGRDPNWGRILQTVGAGRIRLNLDRTEVALGGVTVFRKGAATGPGARRRAARKLEASEVEVSVYLGVGRSKSVVWTCDLTYDYVRINAEYTT